MRWAGGWERLGDIKRRREDHGVAREEGLQEPFEALSLAFGAAGDADAPVGVHPLKEHGGEGLDHLLGALAGLAQADDVIVGAGVEGEGRLIRVARGRGEVRAIGIGGDGDLWEVDTREAIGGLDELCEGEVVGGGREEEGSLFEGDVVLSLALLKELFEAREAGLGLDDEEEGALVLWEVVKQGVKVWVEGGEDGVDADEVDV